MDQHHRYNRGLKSTLESGQQCYTCLASYRRCRRNTQLKEPNAAIGKLQFDRTLLFMGIGAIADDQCPVCTHGRDRASAYSLVILAAERDRQRRQLVHVWQFHHLEDLGHFASHGFGNDYE